MINRILQLLVLASLTQLPVAVSVQARQTAPPNILFIAVDDLNDWVSPLKGHPQTITPNFDRLTESGTRFTNAHCQAPLCGPSRASLFTGLTPATTGIYLHIDDNRIRNASGPAHRSTFLTEWFEANGYTTMGAGKLLHQGAGANLLQQWGGHSSHGPRPSENFKYESGGTSTDWGAYPQRDSLMPDHRVASYGVEQLNRSHDKPFFLALGFNRPHVPFYVPQKWFDRIDLETVETPPYLENDLDDAPAISRTIHNMPPTPETEWLIERDYWKEVVQAYLACVAFVDHQLGRVLDALEASEHADNTIIVLWSDHGYHLGEKNIVAKMTVYEESTRVPLIFAGPGIAVNATSTRPVGLIDIYPTLLELAGLPANPTNEGRSLVPLLQDPEAEWEYPALTYWGRNNTAVRTERYRYIRYEDGSEELYDRRSDPNEWNNIADDPATAAIRARLRQHIPASQAPLSAESHFGWNSYWRQKTNAAKRNRFDRRNSWSYWADSSNPGSVTFQTGDFMGRIAVFEPFVYSFALNTWFYLPEYFLESGGTWAYIMR